MSSTQVEYYERQREAQRVSKADGRQKGRDIGPIAAIKDVKRRESCRYDLALFAKTYNPRAFYLDWSEIHRYSIAKMQEAILQGAMYAFAWPRGGGKTTLSKTACWWAVSYAHRRYPFFIGANLTKAQKSLDSIKTWIRFNKTYIEDFPEICQAARELGGKGNAAGGQNCNGEPTMITWSKDEIVLPTVPCPPNMPDEFKADWAPTSGSMIGVSGLTGDGIRGSVKTTTEGDELRPDFVLPDDPQTDESAKSRQQNEDRYELITGAVLGMAGPDKDISLIMPCTVIKPDDMVSQVLDREKNPLFRGVRMGILTAMPKNMELWEEYFGLYQAGVLMDPPTYEASNQFYIDNQEAMDEGTRATWPERFRKNEVSAVQSAMNLYCLNPVTFAAEYMNDPISRSDDVQFLTAEEITKKQSTYLRFEVPLETRKITVFVDVQKEILVYCIIAWEDNFSGHVIDYGTFPQQKRINWFKADIPITLASKYPELSAKGRIYQALMDFSEVLKEIRIVRSGDKAPMQISRVGVDSRYQTSTIRRFIRDVKDNLFVPTMGGQFGARQKPMNHPDYVKKWTSGGRSLGTHWRQNEAKQGVQTIEISPNFWKTFVQECLATPFGSDGCLSLYAEKQHQLHSLFANHLTAEFRTPLEGPYGKVDEWKPRPGNPDNDWLDCVVGCAVLANFEGIETTGVTVERGRTRRKKLDASKWGDAG